MCCAPRAPRACKDVFPRCAREARNNDRLLLRAARGAQDVRSFARATRAIRAAHDVTHVVSTLLVRVAV